MDGALTLNHISGTAAAFTIGLSPRGWPYFRLSYGIGLKSYAVEGR
jgi:hypothetical protein